uniref:Uncharacterized protein n=1 Tax=Sphaerodactylus townsendi TaxID=933632 RepID=A0ACB8G9Z9_9SAUR
MVQMTAREDLAPVVLIDPRAKGPRSGSCVLRRSLLSPLMTGWRVREEMTVSSGVSTLTALRRVNGPSGKFHGCCCKNAKPERCRVTCRVVGVVSAELIVPRAPLAGFRAVAAESRNICPRSLSANIHGEEGKGFPLTPELLPLQMLHLNTPPGTVWSTPGRRPALGREKESLPPAPDGKAAQ